MQPEDEMPDQGEQEPGHQEAGEERKEEPAPPQVHQGCPAVLEEDQALLLHPYVDHPQVSILFHQSSYWSFSFHKSSQIHLSSTHIDILD